MSVQPSTEQIERADQLKDEGNQLVKDNKVKEAIGKYNEALHLNQDPIYYCNRAAAYCLLEQYDDAIKDCHSALTLKPGYAKAYGRLGLALSCKNMHKDAVKAYKKALEFAPNNHIYKQYLEVAESKLKDATTANNSQANLNTPLGSLSNIINNPEFMQMATQMMNDPNIQNMMTEMMGNLVKSTSDQGGVQDNFHRASETLKERMRESNRELYEQLERMKLDEQVRGAFPNNPIDGEAPNVEEMIRAGETIAQQLRESNPELIEDLLRENALVETPENLAEMLRAGQMMAERIRNENPQLLEQMQRAFEQSSAGNSENAGKKSNNYGKKGSR